MTVPEHCPVVLGPRCPPVTCPFNQFLNGLFCIEGVSIEFLSPYSSGETVLFLPVTQHLSAGLEGGPGS